MVMVQFPVCRLHGGNWIFGSVSALAISPLRPAYVFQCVGYGSKCRDQRCCIAEVSIRIAGVRSRTLKESLPVIPRSLLGMPSLRLWLVIGGVGVEIQDCPTSGLPFYTPDHGNFCKKICDLPNMAERR
jgi:hypothetical protein